jgi:hypothetical protein
VSRVEASPRCAGLFAELGADGVRMLATSLYFRAPIAKQTGVCRRAEAYTHVGAAPTFLCDRFGRLSHEQSALVLIHEALHHAGLEESPAVPGAMSSAAINDMVQKACGFGSFTKVGQTS